MASWVNNLIKDILWDSAFGEWGSMLLSPTLFQDRVLGDGAAVMESN